MTAKGLLLFLALLSFAFAYAEIPTPFFSDGGSSTAWVLMSVDSGETYIVYDQPDVNKHNYHEVGSLSGVFLWDDFLGSDLNLSKWQFGGTVGYRVQSGYLQAWSTISGYDARIQSKVSYTGDKTNTFWLSRIYTDKDGSKYVFVGPQRSDSFGPIIWSDNRDWGVKEDTGHIAWVGSKTTEHAFLHYMGSDTMKFFTDGVQKATASITKVNATYGYWMNNRDTETDRILFVDYILWGNLSAFTEITDSNITVISKETGDFLVNGKIYHRKRLVTFPVTGQVFWRKSGGIAYVKKVENLSNTVTARFLEPPIRTFERVPVKIEVFGTEGLTYNVSLYVDGVSMTSWLVSEDTNLTYSFVPTERGRYYTLTAEWYPTLLPSAKNSTATVTYYTYSAVEVDIQAEPKGGGFVGNVTVHTLPPYLEAVLDIKCENEFGKVGVFHGIVNDGQTVDVSNLCIGKEVTVKAEAWLRHDNIIRDENSVTLVLNTSELLMTVEPLLYSEYAPVYFDRPENTTCRVHDYYLLGNALKTRVIWERENVSSPAFVPIRVRLTSLTDSGASSVDIVPREQVIEVVCEGNNQTYMGRKTVVAVEPGQASWWLAVLSTSLLLLIVGVGAILYSDYGVFVALGGILFFLYAFIGTAVAGLTLAKIFLLQLVVGAVVMVFAVYLLLRMVIQDTIGGGLNEEL